MVWQRTSHATYHPECCKTGSDGGSYVSTHGDARVDIYSEVTDNGHRRHSSVADAFLKSVAQQDEEEEQQQD